MKLLLHTCCAPCSGAIVEALLGEGIRPVIYYCNPNIFPREEYEKRRDECRRYASGCGLDMVEADYSHETWLQCVRGLEDEPERGARCSACFRHRLLASAQYAISHGFDTLATTLASSRWKNLDQVNEAGRWAVDFANAEAASYTALDACRNPFPQVDTIEDAVAAATLREQRSLSDDARRQCLRESGSPLPTGGGTRGFAVGGVLSEGMSDGARRQCLRESGSPLPTGGGTRGFAVGGVLPETPPAGAPVPALQWWDRNWRKGGLQERRGQIIKEQGFYNQQWCGCEFSIRQ